MAASTMVAIQNRTVIFDSWNSLFGLVNLTEQPDSTRSIDVRKWSWMGVRLNNRCFTPFRLPDL